MVDVETRGKQPWFPFANTKTQPLEIIIIVFTNLIILMLLIIVSGLWVDFIPILYSSDIKRYMRRIPIEIRFEIIQLSTISHPEKKINEHSFRSF